MPNLISISCLQYTSQSDEMVTLKIIKPLINQAIDLGSNLIALPECATSIKESSEITMK